MKKLFGKKELLSPLALLLALLMAMTMTTVAFATARETDVVLESVKVDGETIDATGLDDTDSANKGDRADSDNALLIFMGEDEWVDYELAVVGLTTDTEIEFTLGETATCSVTKGSTDANINPENGETVTVKGLAANKVHEIEFENESKDTVTVGVYAAARVNITVTGEIEELEDDAVTVEYDGKNNSNDRTLTLEDFDEGGGDLKTREFLDFDSGTDGDKVTITVASSGTTSPVVKLDGEEDNQDLTDEGDGVYSFYCTDSAVYDVTVTFGEDDTDEPNPGETEGDITVHDVDFDSVKEGYTQPTAKPIKIVNNTDINLTVKNIDLGGNNFEIVADVASGGTTIGAKDTDSTITIRPVQNLKANKYQTKIIVDYVIDGGDEAYDDTAHANFVVTAADTTPTTPTTPTTSSNSKSSSSGGSSGGGGGGSATPIVPKSANVNNDGSVNSTTVTNDLKKAISASTGNEAVVQIKNAESISASTLQSLAKAADAAGKEAVLHADTVGADGMIQARLYIDPAKLAGNSNGLKLGVATQGARPAARKLFFEKHFDNKVAVISCAQQGSFGAKIKIAAKVQLPGNGQNLSFYSYDAATNKYQKIETAYRIDKNGYIHFETELAGDIIISDKPLARK